MIVKVIAQWEQSDLNQVFQLFDVKKFEIAFAEDYLYLSKPLGTKIEVEEILQNLKISNFFIQELQENPMSGNHFIQTWFQEKKDKECKQQIEEEKQEELQQMLDNIATIQQEINKLYKKNIKEEEEVVRDN